MIPDCNSQGVSWSPSNRYLNGSKLAITRRLCDNQIIGLVDVLVHGQVLAYTPDARSEPSVELPLITDSLEELSAMPIKTLKKVAPVLNFTTAFPTCNPVMCSYGAVSPCSKFQIKKYVMN